MIRWRQSDIRDVDGTNSWANLEAAVVQNAKGLALLQQIVEKPTFSFPIQYDGGIADLNFTYLHLVESKRAAQRLETAALCALHQNDPALAAKDLRAILALVKATRNERLAISELVRIAIASIAVSVSWEVLQSPNLTDGQLAELQNDWAGLDFIRAEENSLAMERVSGEISLAKWRSSYSEMRNYFDLGRKARATMGISDDVTILSNAKMTAKMFLWRNWWSYPDELRMLEGYEVLLTTIRCADTNGFFNTALQEQDAKLNQLGISKLNNEFDSLFSGETDFRSMLSESIVTLAGVSRKVMGVEAAKRLTVTAMALRRYQLKHGNYPPTLNSLTPEFISAVPLDAVDGKPLRYRPNADGTFLLYSVGENGKDNGGDPSLEKGVASSNYGWQNIHALDWVWPQPATEKEIQAYYQDIPSKSN